MKIGGALADRLVHDRVHEPDYRAVLFRAGDRVLGDDALLLLADELLQPAPQRVVAVHGLADVGLGGYDHFDLEPRRLLHLVEGHDVERVGHRDREGVPDLEERDELELALNPLRHEPHDLRLEDVRGEIHARDSELLLVVVEDGLLGDQLEPKQNLAERLPRAPLLLERAGEALAGQMSLLDEALPQRFPPTCRHRRSRVEMKTKPGCRIWETGFSSQVSAGGGRNWRRLGEANYG